MLLVWTRAPLTVDLPTRFTRSWCSSYWLVAQVFAAMAMVPLGSCMRVDCSGPSVSAISSSVQSRLAMLFPSSTSGLVDSNFSLRNF